jgi:hypothetical protein
MPLNTGAAYNTLLANPGGFLKNYPVRIFGDAHASGLANYTMVNVGASMRPGSIMGNLKMHATESFAIRSAAAMMALAAGHGGHAFQAHSIHMDVGTAAMGFYVLGAGGPNIMVTGQLSGCSFVMIPGAIAGQVRVAHVQPQGMTGQALAAQLTGIANSQVYGASATTGNYDAVDRAASIIGCRIGGQWCIYAQKQDRGAGDYRIKSVYQIYPNRQKL